MSGLVRVTSSWQPNVRPRRHVLRLACGHQEERPARAGRPAPARVRHACPPGPDVGAWRAAEEMTGRLGVAVSREAIAVLAERGIVGYAGDFKGCQLYDGGDLVRVTRAQAAGAEEAADAARLLNRKEAARRLGIVRDDLDMLIEAGALAPAETKPGAWQGRVLLFAPAALDALAATADIDWAAVRARPRRRSPELAAYAEQARLYAVLTGQSWGHPQAGP